jgi:Protein of unknown function (DUF3108)
MMFRATCALFLVIVPASAQSGFPFSDEALSYRVNWPSGLSLGEGRMTAVHSQASKGEGDRWEFELSLDAAIPGFKVSDHYRANASADFCSSHLVKEATHGERKANESTVFDLHRHVAERSTEGGGKSESEINNCAHDALTFLFLTRRELSQGRVPPAEAVFFGARYQARLEYTGPQSISVGGKKAEADRVVAHLKGPASDVTVEFFFARDPARTPLLIRAPFSMGTFAMELVR